MTINLSIEPPQTRAPIFLTADHAGLGSSRRHVQMAHAAYLPLAENFPLPTQRRVGFLFNHEGLHQLRHTAPVISALQRQAPWMQVDILVSSEAQAVAVRALLDPAVVPPAIYHLRPGAGSTLLEWMIGRAAPLRRIATLKRNLAIFRKFDALVVPESTSLLLKTRFGLNKIKLINLPHGAGDGSIGFARELSEFDYFLLSGEKIRTRMTDAGIVRADNHAIVGYPKFDTIENGSRPKLFGDDKPIVLYNPHFNPMLSSWYRLGEQVLNYFARQNRFNLIFAPHVMLFRRKLHASVEHRRPRVRRRLPERFNFAPNILIDLGSTRSMDMTYTRAADVYLGDVSSQIYEFIMQPRPALFLDAHQVDWRENPNYQHWRLGPVLRGVADLDGALSDRGAHEERYGAVQRQAFTQTFSLDPRRSSAQRAADAIAGFLSREDEGGRAAAP